MLNEVRYVPGAADARIQQPFNYPNFTVNVDRTRAAEHRPDAAERGAEPAGGAQRQLPDQPQLLSRSAQRRFLQHRHPGAAVPHGHHGRAGEPAHHQFGNDCGDDQPSGSTSTGAPGLRRWAAWRPRRPPDATTAAPGAPKPVQVLGNLATIVPGAEQGTISHYDVQPVIDIYTNVEGTDLGSVTRAMEKIVAAHQKDLPRGSHFILRGQSETMYRSYIGLLSGLAFSILLVYLLIVVNFQSWLDPFLIISALPAALAGIVWFLFLTGTRLSVPALTGAIMCMGVATANSILVVSFAREQLEILVGDARRAALNAGFVRLRPVLMTALAMIIGMVPMALGLGDGGEQNAPLGRAVIGGLLLATVATLFFVPAFFSFIHGRIERRRRARRRFAHAARFDEFDERPE